MQASIEQIKSFQLFSALSDSKAESLIPVFEIVTFKAGERIFKEFDDGDSMYFILGGCVEIRKCVDHDCDAEMSLAILPKGEFFGEMSLLTGESRSASAVVLEDGTFMKISRDNHLESMIKDPDMISSLLGGLVTAISKRLREVSFESVTLYETGRIVSNTRNIVDLSEKILERLVRATDSENGVILLWNEIIDCFEVQAIIGDKNHELVVSAFSGDSEFSEFLFGIKEPFITGEKNIHEEIGKMGLENLELIYAPLFTDALVPNSDYRYVKKVEGVIILGHSDQNHFTLANLTLIKGVAEQVGQALFNAKLMQENESRMAYEQVFVTPF